MLAGTKIELQCKEKLIRCNTFLVVPRLLAFQDGSLLDICCSRIHTHSKQCRSASDDKEPGIRCNNNNNPQHNKL